jgi:hypothetical protein
MEKSGVDDLLTFVPRWVRILLVFFGLGVVATGAAAVFQTENGAGSASLVAAGVALVVLGVLLERLESLEAAGVKLQLRKAQREEEAQIKQQAANLADQRGDSSKAEVLQLQAEELQREAHLMGAAYEGLRRQMSSGPQRTAEFSRLMTQASRLASVSSPDEVRGIFESGDGGRVIALRLMAEDSANADAFLVKDAILNSRSAFEQYQALRVARALVRDNPDGQVTADVLQAVRQGVEGGQIRRRTDRHALAVKILEGQQVKQ